MKLIFIRHGEAAAATPDDARTLTDKGRAQAQSTAEFLASNHKATVLIYSPFARAVQTAEFVATACQIPVNRQLICSQITPEDDADLAITALAALIDGASIGDDDTVAIVCHMNIVAHMASIVGGAPFAAFALAEARVFLGEIGHSTAEQVAQFVPDV